MKALIVIAMTALCSRDRSGTVVRRTIGAPRTVAPSALSARRRRGDGDRLDRDQWQAEVPDRGEEPVQGGLVGQLAADEGRSVRLRRPGEISQQGRPGRRELALDAHSDLVADRVTHRGPPYALVLWAGSHDRA